MDEEMIGQVRSFSRTVTQCVGALNEGFLARHRPLGPTRLLWEIGSDGADLRQLRSRVDLDSGYLSKLLRTLEAEGLAIVEQNEADGRVRTARLTASGAAERAELDRRSDEAACRILEPLSGPQRTRLVAAMAEIERLLTASAIRVSPADPQDQAARAAMTAYFGELALRFARGFDPALSISADDSELRLPAGQLLLATLRTEPVGIGALKFHDDGPAEVKRMWVAPAVRGMGLGRRLLAELEARAAERGVVTLRLETNRALEEAIGLYRSAGYREVAAFNDEAYADHWFEKTIGGAGGA